MKKEKNKKTVALLTEVASLFAFQMKTDSLGNALILPADSAAAELPDIEDKTAFEALESHVHLLDRPTKKQIKKLIPVGERLGRGVLASLTAQFPGKQFRVYVTISPESMILRFHQVWPGEPPYYEDDARYPDTVLLIFCNQQPNESL